MKLIPVLDAWSRYVGVELRKQGSRFAVRCPWHSDGNERTASMFLNPVKNNFYCYGCQKGGSVIDLAMLALNLDFREACRTLASDFGIEWGGRPPTMEERRKAREEAKKRELVKAFRAWCERAYMDICVLIRCVDKVLHQHPEQAEELSEILNMEPIWCYWLDILQGGTDEERFLLFNSEAVKKWLILT